MHDGRPFYFLEKRLHIYRDICEHEERECESIENLLYRIRVNLFPLGDGGYRAERPEEQIGISERLHDGAEGYHFVGTFKTARDNECSVYDKACESDDDGGEYRHEHIIAGKAAMAEYAAEKVFSVVAEHLQKSL